MRIRAATFADLPAIAKCHRKAFPNALSSMMGYKYLYKMLEWYLIDERAFLVLAELNGVCFGYCGGLRVEQAGRDGAASSMIQYSFSNALLALLARPWLLVHKEFLAKYRLALRNLRKRFSLLLDASTEKPTKQVHGAIVEPHVGLIVIGVAPTFQGKGYGSLLLQEFERIASGMGHRRLSLTVRSDNAVAIRAYKRNQWVVTKTVGASTTMKKNI